MATWIRQPQEQEGTYLFGGWFGCTVSVQEELSSDEIKAIYNEIKEAVKVNNGLDYLQVFKDENGRKLYFIDSINREAIESELYDINDPNVNYCMLMFAEEY